MRPGLPDNALTRTDLVRQVAGGGRQRWAGLRFAAWVAWLVLSAVIAVTAAVRPQAHSVYGIYAGAARDWWAGRDMYHDRPEPYRYSPLFAVAVTPWALLPDRVGTPLWKMFSIAVYALALRTWTMQALPTRLGRRELAALFLLVLPGSMHSMYNGQANLLMLAACLLGGAAAAQGRWSSAALWIAAATLIKGYPLALGLLLGVLYPRRFMGRFLVALGIGLVLPFAAQTPPRVIAQYGSWSDHLRGSTVAMRERLRSVDHLLAVWGHPVTPALFARMGLAAGVAILVASLWYARRTGDPRGRVTQVFLLFSVWVVLFGPATETCTYVVAAPAVAWALLEARRHGTPLTLAMLLGSLILMGPLVTDAFGSVVRNFANAHGSQPLGALLLSAYVLRRPPPARGSGFCPHPRAQAA